MKPITKIKLKFFLLIIVLSIGNISRSQVLEVDSLALIALYNATDGANWDNNNNWLIEPVDEWYGVDVTGDRVTLLGWLSGNNLSGNIPSDLGNLSELRTLYLQGNELTGTIPSELGNLSKLESLYLYNNQLSGSIPPELGNLSALKELIMSNNQFTGQIPDELGNLSNLTELTLSQNQFSGSIPKELGNLTGLRFLLLWDNNLTGEIPDELGNLSIILRLNIYDNELEGEIPEQLGSLSLIRDLILNKNNLNGAIPSSFSQLTSLLNFNISENQLKDLPDLSNLTQLTLFDVSLNCFGDDDIQTNIDVITSNIGQNICSENITIITQPIDVSDCEGANISFSVSASGTTNLQYQWQEDQGSGFVNLADQGLVSGSNTNQLTILNVQPAMDNFQYRCVVSGDNADDAISDTASLTVTEIAAIASQSANAVSICEGQNHTFSITDQGDAVISYEWYKDNAIITGTANSFYEISDLKNSDAGEYKVIATNDCGIDSAFFQLEILQNPAITSQPTDQTVIQGASVTLTIESTGENLSYQWQKDGFDISGATSSMFTISQTNVDDEGVYQCIVSNNCEAESSQTVILTVNESMILEVNTNSELAVYPNPAFGTLYVNGASSESIWSITFIDLSGMVVGSFLISQSDNKLSVASIPQGIYWVRIIKDQKEIFTQKLILK